MAFTSRGHVNAVAQSAAGTTVLLTASAITVSAGNLAIIVIGADNSSTTDGDNSEVSTVTDSGGNTWTKAREHTNGNGAASAGATVSMWYSKLGTALTAGAGVVTVTFASSRLQRAATMWAWTIGDSTPTIEASTATATDAARLGTANLSTALTSREYLFVRGDGAEGDIATYSATAAYTGFNWIIASNGAAVAAQLTVAGEFKITTSTSAISTASINLNYDTASVFVAFYESASAVVLRTLALTGAGL